MVTDRLETPSQLRFFGSCLVAATLSLAVVVWLPVDAWLLLPVAVVVLAGLTVVDGYWRART